jgi:small-conductance mechanosensitive channel
LTIGGVNWVEIDVGKDAEDFDHLISPEERLHPGIRGHSTRSWGENLRELLILTAKTLALGMAEALPGIFVAVVMTYPYIPGSGSDAFKGIGIFVGLVASLGSTALAGQAASGLVLTYSRAFRPGDYLKIGETGGTVLSLGMLSTKIRPIKQEEVTIPNAGLIGATIKNYSRMAGREGVILYTSVTIGYNAPWRQVHEMLMMAADRTAGLKKEPRPFVLQTALSDFYVEYQINAYLEEPQKRIPTLASLHANIQDAFNEYGVQIMSPHYVLDPAEKVWVPREKWFDPPAKTEEGLKKGG